MPLNDHPTAKPTYDFYDTVDGRPDGGRERRARVGARTMAARQRSSPAARLPGTGTRARRSPATWSRTASATTR